ncbi:MAG: cytochrome c3 family protein [Myxococcaceae bacterium]
MGPLFPRWTNSLSRASALALLATPAIAVAALMLYVRSPFVTGQDIQREQPVQFDHRHHVADEGIDCRYCHTTVDSAPTAGIPPLSTCMSCHAQIWNQSPKLELVREAYFTGMPLKWNRVHNLPNFVYFNHSIHVNKGVGCVACHGRVDQMAAIMQAQPLTMRWCLDCHRDPGPNLRPPELATSMTWEPPEGAEGAALAQQLIQSNQVHSRTSCSTCHR